ncbi:MAG: right-handed parallel beta-helix repeat-containing protein [Candidatus Sifarchaeia archaeon]
MVLIIILLFTQCIIPIIGENNQSEPSNPISRFQVSSYSNHDPINITSDANFAAQKAIEGWSGTGSETDPYIIEGYNITRTGYNIMISDVTAYFEIRNCYLTSNSSTVLTEPYDTTICFFNVYNGFILNNTIVKKTDGAIYQSYSQSVIANNTITGCRMGVILTNSSFCIVDSNMITGINDISILMLESSYCNITRNDFSTIWGHSAFIQESFECYIENNGFENHSVTIERSHNFGFANNGLAEGAGIEMFNVSDMIFSHNFIQNPDPCGFDIVSSERITVSYNYIEGAGGDGISADHARNCVFLGNLIARCGYGIRLTEGVGNRITYNHITMQEYYGISLSYSSNSKLFGKLIASEGYGAAGDWGVDNEWDDGVSIGNFWESIVEDHNVRIIGTANSIDHFGKLINQSYWPYIYHEPFVEVIEDEGAILTWIVWSIPFLYAINISGSEFSTGYREGSGPIELDLTSLPAGYCTCELVVFPIYLIADARSPPFNVTIPSLWSTDSDSDLMPDLWENENGLDPFFDDSGGDPDSDELSNLDEYLSGTDPKNPDSDFDSMFDGWEIRYGLDPLNANDAGLDLDSDSLTNLQEFELGTDPTNPDSDSDNFPDAWEVRNGFDPTNPAVPLMQHFVANASNIAIASSLVILMMSILYLRVFKKRFRREDQVKQDEDDIRAALEELLE